MANEDGYERWCEERDAAEILSDTVEEYAVATEWLRRLWLAQLVETQIAKTRRDALLKRLGRISKALRGEEAEGE